MKGAVLIRTLVCLLASASLTAVRAADKKEPEAAPAERAKTNRKTRVFPNSPSRSLSTSLLKTITC